MENKSVKEYTKLEQYQYIQQHYNDTLKQTNLMKKLAKELEISNSRAYGMIQTILNAKGLTYSTSHILKKELNIAKMVFANRSEHQEPITQQISEKTSETKLPMFNQNISSLTISITELVMKKCPFLDKEQVTKRIESLLNYMITSKTAIPQLLFENLEIVLLAFFYKSSLFHDGEEAKFYIRFGDINEKCQEIFFNAVWTEKGVRKAGFKSFFQIETNESMITKIVAFLRAKPDKIHEVVNILK